MKHLLMLDFFTLATSLESNSIYFTGKHQGKTMQLTPRLALILPDKPSQVLRTFLETGKKPVTLPMGRTRLNP